MDIGPWASLPSQMKQPTKRWAVRLTGEALPEQRGGEPSVGSRFSQQVHCRLEELSETHHIWPFWEMTRQNLFCREQGRENELY